MSKPNSGLFVGTKGQRAKEPLPDDKKPSRSEIIANMQVEANHWAEDEAQRLLDISKRQRDKFNTVCVVYDELTERYYYGRNSGIKINNSILNPIIFGSDDAKGLLPQRSLNNYELGNCAEVDAINNALNAGAKLANLHIMVLHSTTNNFGSTKKSCENCTYAFKGIVKENYSGWSEIKDGI